MLWLPIEPGQQDLSSGKGSKTVRASIAPPTLLFGRDVSAQKGAEARARQISPA
jgi:hypothetical protein